MSKLSDTVKKVRIFIYGFLGFAILVMVIQIVAMNQQNNIVTPPATIEYYVPATKTSLNYSRYEPPSLSISDNLVEFVKVGDFPKFSNSVNVYPVKEKIVSLSSQEKASQAALRLKLETNYITKPNGIYIWESKDKAASLEYSQKEQSIDYKNATARTGDSKLNKKLTEQEFINRARNLFAILQVDTYAGAVSGRVDYVNLDANGNPSSVKTIAEANFVRISLFKNLEIATIKKEYENQSQTNPKIPASIVGEIRRPIVTDGYMTIIVKGEVNKIDDIVELEFTPNTYEVKPDVYKAELIGNAFENLKNGVPGSSLVYLVKKETNVFVPYTKLTVRQFTINADKTKLVYVEPPNWSHIDPTKWNGVLYPFYWFEGVAQLDNNDQADFVFLVDAVAK